LDLCRFCLVFFWRVGGGGGEYEMDLNEYDFPASRQHAGNSNIRHVTVRPLQKKWQCQTQSDAQWTARLNCQGEGLARTILCGVPTVETSLLHPFKAILFSHLLFPPSQPPPRFFFKPDVEHPKSSVGVR
jgi:hypothetical protein